VSFDDIEVSDLASLLSPNFVFTTKSHIMPSIMDSKCILVIGSTSGIGRALALAIIDLPSKPTVIICGRRKERLDELVASHGATGRLKSVTLDVLAERDALKVSIQRIVNIYPDVCVLNDSL
jgi:short-subunit dehydrogenase involved in D-alanine esterification of teichoic acids